MDPWAHQTMWPSSSITSSDSETLAVSVDISPSSVVLKEVSSSWSSSASISTRVLANHSASVRAQVSSSMTLSKTDKISKTSQSNAAFHFSLSVSESRHIPKSVSSISLSASAIRGSQTTVQPSGSLSLSNSQVWPSITIHSAGHVQPAVFTVASATTASLSPADSASVSGSYSRNFSHSQSKSISRSPFALERPSKSKSVILSPRPSTTMTSSQSQAFAPSLNVSSSTAVLKSVSSSWSSRAVSYTHLTLPTKLEV